jgi:hypothetical protein
MTEEEGTAEDFARMLGGSEETEADAEPLDPEPTDPEPMPIDAARRETIAREAGLPEGFGPRLGGEYEEEVQVSAQVLARDAAIGRQLLRPPGKAERQRRILDALHPRREPYAD